MQPESTWPLQAELAASDTTPGNNFGDSVALFGSEAVVGASLAAPAGTAYVFGNL